MSLPEERKEELYKTYGDMAADLRILYHCLRNELFDREETMQIIVAHIRSKSLEKE